MCPDFVIFQDDIPSKKAASNGLTSKFEVRVTKTITESFLVEAEDWRRLKISCSKATSSLTEQKKVKTSMTLMRSMMMAHQNESP